MAAIDNVDNMDMPPERAVCPSPASRNYDDEEPYSPPQHHIRRKPVPVQVMEILEPTPCPSPIPSKRQQATLRPWRVEVCASAMSVCAIMSIIITLYRYDAETLPQLPFHISINSVVSVYTVVLKAALLSVIAPGLGQLTWIWFEKGRVLQDIVVYDLASRGAWGAALLLFRVHTRHILASFGAIVTIVLVAMDPATQQLIRYVDCNHSFGAGVASIPRTNYFSSPVHNLIFTDAVPPESQAAFNAGIFAPGATVAIHCPTGNCTFTQPYTTVGFCSSCDDISDQVQLTKLDNGTWITRLQSGTFVTYSPSSPHLATLNFSHSKPTYDDGYVNTNTAEFLAGKTFMQDAGESIDSVDDEGKPRPDKCKGVLNDDIWRCKGYGAASCRLYPCVRTYKANVQAGVLQENLTEVHTNFGRGSYNITKNDTAMYGILDTSCITDQERKAIVSEGYNITQPWIAYNITSFDISDHSVKNTSYPQSLLTRGCLYVISADFLRRLLSVYVQEALPGTIYGNYSDGMNYEAALKFLTGPQHIQNIYNFGNVSFSRVEQIFQNVSNSLTTYIRQNGDGHNSQPATGEVLHYAVCMSVHWEWMIFPVTMIILTFLFFASLVLSVEKSGSHVWKSSPLPLIFRGPFVGTSESAQEVPCDQKKVFSPDLSSLDENSDLLYNANTEHTRRTRGMEEVARAIRVQLDRHDSMLRVQPGSPPC